jgi:hypothetical protein
MDHQCESPFVETTPQNNGEWSPEDTARSNVKQFSKNAQFLYCFQVEQIEYRWNGTASWILTQWWHP